MPCTPGHTRHYLRIMSDVQSTGHWSSYSLQRNSSRLSPALRTFATLLKAVIPTKLPRTRCFEIQVSLREPRRVPKVGFVPVPKRTGTGHMSVSIRLHTCSGKSFTIAIRIACEPLLPNLHRGHTHSANTCSKSAKGLFVSFGF